MGLGLFEGIVIMSIFAWVGALSYEIEKVTILKKSFSARRFIRNAIILQAIFIIIAILNSVFG